MRILFWGTPKTAVPFLEFLLRQEDVAAVVTRPDKPSQRGQAIRKSPVKVLAEEKKIQLLQPTNLKDPEFLNALASSQAEAGIVVAYGRLLPPEVIRLFPKGIYNIHFSLLPRLRGAAPMQWAILNGEKQTGVSSFRIAETLDTGNVLVQKSVAVSPQDNALSLEEKLVPLGVLVLEETLKKVRAGEAQGIPQSGEATSAPLLRKEDAKIAWQKPAEDVARQVRALIHPGAFTHLSDGRLLKILRAEPLAGASSDAAGAPDASVEPGTVCAVEKGKGFVVSCGVGSLLVLRVQLEGKKETDAWSFLQGARLKEGEKLQ